MNREAAALDVPVYSTFRGKIGAVDQYLSKTGRLVLLESADDVRGRLKLERRPRPSQPGARDNATLTTIVDHIVGVMHPAAAAVEHRKVAAA